MNSTNRVLNRLLIVLFGLVLLAIGIAAILLGTVMVVRDWWTQNAPTLYRTVSDGLAASPLYTTGHSWMWIALALLCVIVIILMLILIFQQGRGHTGTLVSQRTSRDSADQHVDGAVIIEASVAERMLRESLDGNPEFVSSSVSTYRVRGLPVLKISTTVRRGVAPPRAIDIIQRNLRTWDRVLGVEIPTLIQLSGGFRTRMSSTTRLPEQTALRADPTDLLPGVQRR